MQRRVAGDANPQPGDESPVADLRQLFKTVKRHLAHAWKTLDPESPASAVSAAATVNWPIIY